MIHVLFELTWFVRLAVPETRQKTSARPVEEVDGPSPWQQLAWTTDRWLGYSGRGQTPTSALLHISVTKIKHICSLV